MSRDQRFAPRSPIGPRLLARCAGLALAATLSVGCTPTTSSAPAPMSPRGAAPSPFPQEMVAGGHIMVNRGGQWLPATIVEPLGGDRYLVSYDGASAQWNEPVGMDRIKPVSTYGTQPVAHDYRQGERVLVTSQARLLVGDIVQQVAADSWRVHYDGYGAEGAENVTSDRLRRTYMGPSAHAVGESVLVEYNGQLNPARVLAASATDRWVVRFEGAGPQYDQDVGVDKIRSAQAAPPPAPPPPVAPPPAAPPEPPAKPEKGGKKPPPAAAPAPPPPAPPVAPAPPAPLQIGDTVVVLERGIYFPAQITGVGTTGWKVRFQGAAAEEEVAADRVGRQLAPLKGVRYVPGQPVLVEWHGMFATGKILKEAGRAEYTVRFDGMTGEADEVVNTKRLRPRQ
jgi:hypothetical protein